MRFFIFLVAVFILSFFIGQVWLARSAAAEVLIKERGAIIATSPEDLPGAVSRGTVNFFSSPDRSAELNRHRQQQALEEQRRFELDRAALQAPRTTTVILQRTTILQLDPVNRHNQHPSQRNHR